MYAEMKQYPFVIRRLSYRSIINLRNFICGFKLENNGTQTIIAAANRNSGLSYPVAEIKNIVSGSMGKCEYVLINCLPCFTQNPSGLA